MINLTPGVCHPVGYSEVLTVPRLVVNILSLLVLVSILIGDPFDNDPSSVWHIGYLVCAFMN